MISNITNRNISMILAVSSFAGLLYCIYSTIYKSTNWSLLCPIVISDRDIHEVLFNLSQRSEKRQHLWVG